MSRLPSVSDTQAAAFIASCLAPLPADAEPVESKEFLRQRRRERRDSKKAASAAWHVELMSLEIADHQLGIVQCTMARGRTLGQKYTPDLHAANVAAMAQRDHHLHLLMLHPAPSRYELKWKRQQLRRASSRPSAEPEKYQAAIAADEARLGVRP